ncbi:hypothetical protein UR09_02870 [Candidatus Nitromaritima sp. SCGC AAA799-A02]|nr:hypothetical protein UZ36_06915 [Candidatus Nitromaritima sp. SCGC AAA799-C22]KMP11626.1 hypothetical protein UR09_02870 [Candidatus Nitromaritima sp. SCGC AAA799-A02]
MSDEYLTILNSVDFFNEFTLDEKREIAEAKSNITVYANGDYIIKQGDVDLTIFVLLQGEASVFKQEIPNVEIARLKPGSVFGEMSAILKAVRTTHVVAKSAGTMALKLDSDLWEILNPKTCHKFNEQFLSVLALRISDMNSTISNLKLKLETVVNAHHEIIKRVNDNSTMLEESLKYVDNTLQKSDQ